MAGRFIEQRFREEGIATNLVHAGLESCTCTSILDITNQTMTEFYEKGYPIPAVKANEMVYDLGRIVGGYEAVTLQPAG